MWAQERRTHARTRRSGLLWKRVREVEQLRTGAPHVVVGSEQDERAKGLRGRDDGRQVGAWGGGIVGCIDMSVWVGNSAMLRQD